ncbi:MAG: hypothetical protein C0516_13310 [Gemmatimonas sp.]|nr:hypothetical protein [Gemmatimonas sp.]
MPGALLRLATLRLATLLLFVACGGGSSDGGGLTPPPLPPPPPPPPPAAVARVVLNNVPERLVVGASTTLQAVVTDANGNVLTGRATSWQSSNAEVLSVSSTGNLLAFAPGSAQITVTVESVSASANIAVVPPPVARVRITAPTQIVNEGRTLALSAVATDSSGRTLADRQIVWSSSAPNVASVSGSGVVTGLVQGEAFIAASSEGQRDSVRITVGPALPPALEFVNGPPGGVLPGRLFSVRVRVVDGRTGVTMPYDGLVGVELTTGAAGTLLGNTTVQAVRGEAQFDSLAIMQSGTWQLRVAASGFDAAISQPVVVGNSGNGAITISPITTERTTSGNTSTATYRFTATLRDASGALVATPTTVRAQVARGNVSIVSGATSSSTASGTAAMQVTVTGSGTFDLLLTTPEGQSGVHAMPNVTGGAAQIALQRTAADSVVPVGATMSATLLGIAALNSPTDVHTAIVEVNWSPNAFQLASDSVLTSAGTVTFNRSTLAQGMLRLTIVGTSAIISRGPAVSLASLRFRALEGDGNRGVQRFQVILLEARGPRGELLQERTTTEMSVRIP